MIRGRTLRPEDFLQIARRRVQILVPFLLVSLATFVVVKRLPDRYKSETLIQVVPQRVPEAYVKATVTTRIADRLQSIGQQVMSRSRLEPVIREFGLYPGMVKAGLMEDVVERMRRDMVVLVVRGDAFRISYEAGNPTTAMKVTERLASMYIDENLRDREVLADGTNQFLESQLEAAKGRLIESEKKLEDYNRRYAGQLPTQVGSNLTVLNNAQLQIQALVDSMARDKDRRRDLEAQLTDAGVDISAMDTSATPNLSAAASAVAASARPSPTVTNLEAAIKALEDLQRRLKPEHPDVLRQKRVVADLQKAVQDEMAATAASVSASATPGTMPPPVDRVQAARVSRIAQLQSEVGTLTAQIAAKEKEEVRLRGVVAEYQARVEAAPTRESELTELTRDYGTIQRSYQSLLAKKEDAQIAANLERYQIGEQFKILDPARLPERPVSPNRPMFYGIGAAVGLGLGIALALLLEIRDSSFKTETDIVMMLALPVLAQIPELVTDEEKAAKRRRMAPSFATVGAAAVLGGILFWVFRGDLFQF